MKEMSMKKKIISLLFSLFLIVSIISPALAQDYFFEVPEQDIHVFVEPDGSITIEYFYLFQAQMDAVLIFTFSALIFVRTRFNPKGHIFHRLVVSS